MGKSCANVCPGCSRHCVMGHEHCKYGRKFFAKQQETAPVCEKNQTIGKTYKWEKLVEANGLAWMLLMAASRGKKALRRQAITEETLFQTLDSQEQQELRSLLGKVLEQLP